jgi:hypothetical protein
MATMPSLSPTGQPDSASAWFGTVPGRALLDSEHALVAHAFSERPGQSWLWLGPQAQTLAADGRGLRLASARGGYLGDVRCALPFPLASESIGVVVLQHVVRSGAAGQALLDECARVLVPGGRLWLFGLNPLAPYRWRWRGAGLRASEPLTWRRRLRGIGLVPAPVSQGIGPSWRVCVSDHVQEGPGLRAAYALSAEKRTLPLTPLRRRAAMPLQGAPAA